jgi:hypothetical protein
MCLSSNRDSESSSHCSHLNTPQVHSHSHIMEALTSDNTSSHLLKQLTKHSLYPFLSLILLLTCSSLFRIPHPPTNAQRQPQTTFRGFQPSSHPAIPIHIRRSISVCVSVSRCLLNRTAPHPHGTCTCSCTAARRFDARRK